MKLASKQYSGFLGIAFILVVVGLIGLVSIKIIKGTVDSAIETAPLVDAALEMKLSATKDALLIMEIMTAGDTEKLEEFWREHLDAVKNFDAYGDAILNGAKTDGGAIYATKNEALKTIVKETDLFHNNEFQPRIQKIRDLMLQKFSLLKQSKETMDQLEAHFAKAEASLTHFEDKVKERISKQMKSGASAEEILKTENIWADLAMEMKTTLAQSRVFIEKYAQGLEAKALGKIEKIFEAKTGEFDGWAVALLDGRDTGEGDIAQVKDTELRKMIVEIEKAHDEYRMGAGKFMAIHKELADVGNMLETNDDEADGIAGKMLTMLGGIEKGAKEEIAKAQTDAILITSRSLMIIVITISAGFAIAIFLSYFISRSITKPLDNVIHELTSSSEQLKSAASQVSEASQQLAEGASEQAASIEQTSSTMTEISSMTTRNADNSREAASLATTCNNTAVQGSGTVENMDTAMKEIVESSGKIASIIKIIEGIAFQTNLLALNAAVEAARAGEHGRGFSVVAEEVRSLAHRSADAANNVTTLITDCVKKAETGMELVKKTKDVFSGVASQVKKVVDLVHEISLASEEQSTGIAQITKAIEQMDQVVQQNAANAEETASASEELSAQAISTNDQVGILSVQVRGEGAGVDGKTTVAKKELPKKLVSPRAPKENSHAAGRDNNPQPRTDDPKKIIPLTENEFKDF